MLGTFSSVINRILPAHVVPAALREAQIAVELGDRGIDAVAGMNEAGLMANVLWLVESEYPAYDGRGPGLSIAAWASSSSSRPLCG